MHCFEQNWDDKALRAVSHLVCLLMYYALEEDLIESTEQLQAPPPPGGTLHAVSHCQRVFA